MKVKDLLLYLSNFEANDEVMWKNYGQDTGDLTDFKDEVTEDGRLLIIKKK